MLKTDFFWTDRDQAEERIRGTYLLYGEQVAYVSSLSSSRTKGIVASVTLYPDGTSQAIPLSDPKFFRFRKPLPIGWVNNQGSRRSFFVSRAPRRSRTHGYNADNIQYATVSNRIELTSGRDCVSFEALMSDPQYQEAIKGNYPAMPLVLDKIREKTCIAVSSSLAIARDNTGIRWLMFNEDRVGLFTGADTLLLLSAFSYLREQLVESSEFSVTNIVEF